MNGEMEARGNAGLCTGLGIGFLTVGAYFLVIAPGVSVPAASDFLPSNGMVATFIG